jgi:hypothetical protein
MGTPSVVFLNECMVLNDRPGGKSLESILQGWVRLAKSIS